jgi:hypothetical protein
MTEREIRVGVKAGDVQGADNAALQAAVDQTAGSGGGTVSISPGEYIMRNSLFLRSGVHIRGSGAETVLRKAPMQKSALIECATYGMMDLSVDEPDLFEVGHGVHIGSPERAMGFHGTVATITWKQGNRLGVDIPMNADYASPEHNVRSLFPVVTCTCISNASISDLTIEGNSGTNEYLDGCRGGGIFLLRADDISIRNVTVRDYNGEGISFQQCRRTMVEDCVVENNRGNGLHPGSGSVGAVMRRIRSSGNREDGVFYCLRVTFSLLEECEIVGNGRHGISIGGRDSDNLIRGCRIEGNASHGIFFRNNTPFGVGHRNRIEGCSIIGNCRERDLGQLRIDAPVREVQIVGNRISSKGSKKCDAALSVTSSDCAVALDGNNVESGREAVVAEGLSGVEIVRDAIADLPIGPDSTPKHGDWHLGRQP